MLIASLFTNVFGIVVFLFILWRRLREDFAADLIFKLGFSILIGCGIGTLVAFRFFPDYFFWIGFLGGIAGLFSTLFKFRTKFYEIFEAYIVSMLPWLGFIFLLDSVAHSSLSSFLGFLAILVLIFVSYYLSAHYKNFTWYKSGKIGFAGLATLTLIFISRFILAIFKISMLSFVSKFEPVMSGCAILVCFFLLFDLSRTKE